MLTEYNTKFNSLIKILNLRRSIIKNKQKHIHQISKLVSILHWGRNPDSTRPVVVHVGQLIADLLENIWLEIRVSGRDSALTNVLVHQQEVKPIPLGHGVVKNSPRSRVISVLTEGIQQFS